MGVNTCTGVINRQKKESEKTTIGRLQKSSMSSVITRDSFETNNSFVQGQKMSINEFRACSPPGEGINKMCALIIASPLQGSLMEKERVHPEV